ncbi:MAG TPA: lipopolysaccharide heptosyltransferase II [Chloroflexota bacterium]|nr:lipopolysaccharide heptosyltransferase II [Chloroflexota bacterium]
MGLKRRIKRRLTRAIQAVLFVVIGTLGLGARLFRREPGLGSIDPATVRRILVIRLDLLGDMVNSMTAVEALHERFLDARMTVFTLPHTAAIPRQFPWVAEVLTLDTNRIRSPRNMLRPTTYRDFAGMAMHLRRERFDLCVSLHGRMASLWAFVSGARGRIGYAREGYPFLFTDPLPGGRFDRPRHEVRWDLDLAAAAGASGANRAPALAAAPAASARMAARLAELGVRDGDTLIGIHGGAVNGSAKRWPPMHWAALADRLIAEQGARVVLTGSAGEVAISEDIRRRMRLQPLVLTGTTDIDELLAVLARCDLVLSGDSGPLHMAVALGRPTVSLYGPTDPRIYGPTPRAGQQALVIRRDLRCSPCYNLLATAECPHGQPACMIDISVREVFAAAKAALERVP